MKTTLELDEQKLLSVMKLTGIKTRKAAVDFALSEVQRTAKVRQFLDESFYVTPSGDVIDPDYDVVKLRDMEMGADDALH